jgi:4-oxalomesaconate tautomerase
MTALSCMAMRGGTLKGAYFLRDDLPADLAVRVQVVVDEPIWDGK